MLTPTRAATSSYVMVASIFDCEARRRAAFNAKRVSMPLRSNRVLQWGYDFV